METSTISMAMFNSFFVTNYQRVYHWIGLLEDLQEPPIFNGKKTMVSCINFP